MYSLTVGFGKGCTHWKNQLSAVIGGFSKTIRHNDFILKTNLNQLVQGVANFWDMYVWSDVCRIVYYLVKNVRKSSNGSSLQKGLILGLAFVCVQFYKRLQLSKLSEPVGQVPPGEMLNSGEGNITVMSLNLRIFACILKSVFLITN